MKHEIILVLAICALTAAMVPKDRRAVGTESSPTTPEVRICSEKTPCAWSLYLPSTDIITEKVGNTYCVCSSDMMCVITEDDKIANTYVHRCRPSAEVSDKS